MNLTLDEISNLVLKTLSPEEQRSSITYLDNRVLPAGALTEIDRKQIRTSSPTVVAFVDLMPTMNWAHQCRYLLVDVNTGAIKSIAGRFPPFWKRTPDTLHVIQRGYAVPNWAMPAGDE
jgi:hypothetical protein